jgi:hypothetical protein
MNSDPHRVKEIEITVRIAVIAICIVVMFAMLLFYDYQTNLLEHECPTPVEEKISSAGNRFIVADVINTLQAQPTERALEIMEMSDEEYRALFD